MYETTSYFVFISTEFDDKSNIKTLKIIIGIYVSQIFCSYQLMMN